MTNSNRARLVGVALGALVMAYSSHAAPNSNDATLHLAAAPEDFKALGIGKEIEVREDGRRTPKSSDYFEWWYFDGLLDDGTVVVVWFGDNWLYGSQKRAVDFELTPPGKPTRRVMRTFDDPGAFATDQANIQIGPHSFKGNLQTYAIHVDAAETGGLGCDLVLRRRVASYRPATGYDEAGDRFFAWLVAVPEGAITGTLTADGVTRQVTGSGYHDHNWGNVSPADHIRQLVVGARPKRRPHDHRRRYPWQGRGGGTDIPLLFVADDHGVQVNAYGSDVSAVESSPVRHPDPNHERPINSAVSFATADGNRAEFKISERLLTSSSLLSDQSFVKKMVAAIMSIKPWYSRFVSPITLKLPGQSSQEGEGTLEYFELK